MKEWRQGILRDWLRQFPSASYLDVGCGKAESLRIARGIGLKSRGCDVVDYLCGEDNIDHIMGAHSLPYAGRSFDLVTCNDVMEHILEDDVPGVLREIRRVAGLAILLGISRKPGPLHVTIKSEEWWLHQVEDMDGFQSVRFRDRIPKVKQPYVWIEILCG